MKHTLWMLMLVAACGGQNDELWDRGDRNNSANNGEGGQGTSQPRDPEPEVEHEFDFAQPAVLGAHVYVANETLNSIAVIDSRSLAIRTAPVGFAPTAVAGPTEPSDASRVWVLNSGSSTVSIVTPDSLAVKSAAVMRHANNLAASPDGTWSLAWYAPEAGDRPVGDLSAATLVLADGRAFQLAVGFRIERVQFSDDNARALILSDDGVSVVELEEIKGDTLIPPVALLPPRLQLFDRTDREVILSPDGEWAIARIATYAGVILTELATGTQWEVDLPVQPTDLDWVPGETPRLLGMLSASELAFITTVPDGLIALAEANASNNNQGDPDAGVPDAGGDVGSDPDAGNDAGSDPDADASTPDADPDADAGDAGAGDAGDDPDTGSSLPDGFNFNPAQGFNFITIAQPRLGAAQVAPTGVNALLFSTLNAEKRAVLLDLETMEQRSLAFEKGVRGALGDDTGATYLVLHDSEGAPVPPGTNPADPAFIEASHGVSIVDVASAATRLVLTEGRPDQATLWRGDDGARMFMTFEPSTAASARDVLRVDLLSFSTETFRVPSQPEGLGRIDAAGKIFVQQIHPQGRITFVDVENDRRQTVTGYQLNAGID